MIWNQTSRLQKLSLELTNKLQIISMPFTHISSSTINANLFENTNLTSFYHWYDFDCHKFYFYYRLLSIRCFLKTTVRMHKQFIVMNQDKDLEQNRNDIHQQKSKTWSKLRTFLCCLILSNVNFRERKKKLLIMLFLNNNLSQKRKEKQS